MDSYFEPERKGITGTERFALLEGGYKILRIHTGSGVFFSLKGGGGDGGLKTIGVLQSSVNRRMVC